MRQHSLLVAFALGFLACSGSDSAFDIAYPREWRFSVGGPVGGYVLIVNTGSAPLSLETFQVGSVMDDHPTATVKIEIGSIEAPSIPAGRAGGFLTPLSEAVLVDSGLVKEARANTNSNYLSIEITDAPEGTYDIEASVELSLDGVRATLPFTIHVVPGPTIYANPEIGKRVVLHR